MPIFSDTVDSWDDDAERDMEELKLDEYEKDDNWDWDSEEWDDDVDWSEEY